MSRLSRGQKRGRSFAGAASDGGAGSGVTPIEVRVPAGARDGAPGPGATVGGMPVAAGPGEPVQQAVLDHLHHLARVTGHPVLASVHDERIGYVVPIRVHVDGSSEFAGEPVRREAASGAAVHGGTTQVAPVEAGPRDRATHVLGAVDTRQPTPGTTAPTAPRGAVHDPYAPSQSPVPPPSTTPAGIEPDTRVLRALPEPAEPAPAAALAPRPDCAESAPSPTRRTQPAAAAPTPPGPSVAPFGLQAVPEQVAFITATSGPAQALPGAPNHGGTPPPPAPPAPGTVSPPTGTFGPPPVMPAAPSATSAAAAAPEPTTRPTPALSSARTPEVTAPPTTEADPATGPDRKPTADPTPAPVAVGQDDEVKEPPVREFDSVAEAVLGDAAAGGADGPVAEPMARISAAVKQGRLEEASGLAEQAVAESAATLGDEHPDVLHLRELTAYIAYLATDPLRSFHLSLDLARIRHRLGDPRGAYGNVQSAAAAWRAVREPVQGLHLGRDLIAVWSELAAQDGPAADDLDQLEKARSRMGRLAERARKASGERTAVQ
ncbi:tetratricopeptide repeat protein [Streptomyces sp. NPDC051104]|uniref:tetratricopeptide repeat protein n=1 Tax=Streptomyces sp. NPDC051104 TaxID=3155044 RepID=UPI00342AE93B